MKRASIMFFGSLVLSCSASEFTPSFSAEDSLKAMNTSGHSSTATLEAAETGISSPALIGQWQKLELSADHAAASGNYIEALHLYRKAAFWAANNLKPAHNEQFESSLVAIAELQTLRKSPMAMAAIKDADFNITPSTPETNMLRRRINLANAKILLRQKLFGAAAEKIDQAREKLSNSDSDKLFAADCDTVQAQLYEFSDASEKAKPLVQSAIKLYEEKDAKSAMYAEALRCLARIEREQKHFDSATVLFNKSISAAKLAFGPNNPALAPYYFDAGMTYLVQTPTKPAEAKAAIHSATELGQKLFDKNSADLKTFRHQEQILASGKSFSVAIPGTTNEASELPP